MIKQDETNVPDSLCPAIPIIPHCY